MQDVEYTSAVAFGDQQVTAIKVEPISYGTFVQVWKSIPNNAPKFEVEMQRGRILAQTHFMVGEKRITPDRAALGTLPYDVVKDIIAKLNTGQGIPGKLLNEGDGVTKPVLYKLGTPITMKKSGETITIAEIEFKAGNYAEMEDVLACDHNIEKAMALLSTVATPVGVDNLPRLPMWAVDRITLADGLTIMDTVANRF